MSHQTIFLSHPKWCHTYVSLILLVLGKQKLGLCGYWNFESGTGTGTGNRKMSGTGTGTGRVLAAF